jgi:formylglycine-generating enzyme required for sulfatase activity
VNETDGPSDKKQPNFDLTTPNIPRPNRNQEGGPAAPGSSQDRTMLNEPFQRPEGRPKRPSPAQNKFDLTVVNFNSEPGDEGEDERERVATPPVSRPAPQPHVARPGTVPQTAGPTGRKSSLLLIIGASVLFLLLVGGGLAVYFFSPGKGFTLRVLNAPAGSKVFIDDVPSGVPQSDGTIIVQGLRTGEARDVRVSQEDYADWKTTVTGREGQVQDLTVNMTPLRPKTAAQPQTEIEYNGRMILIPAGEYPMGIDNSNPEESPSHTVSLPAYYIDKYEVTNEQYARFCAATNHPHPVNPFWDTTYFEKRPRMPVIGIAYDDAQAYANWAGKRLPTESEWEKAASWGPNISAKRLYPWGSSPEKTRANVDSDHPTDAGHFSESASGYGVEDMAGNAREWVDAYFDAYPGNTTSNPKFGQGLRVVRGGDFRSGLNFAKTVSRLGVEPGFKTNPGDDKLGRSSLVGFRCAVPADDPRLQASLGKRER